MQITCINWCFLIFEACFLARKDGCSVEVTVYDCTINVWRAEWIVERIDGCMIKPSLSWLAAFPTNILESWFSSGKGRHGGYRVVHLNVSGNLWRTPGGSEGWAHICGLPLAGRSRGPIELESCRPLAIGGSQGAQGMQQLAHRRHVCRGLIETTYFPVALRCRS